MDDAIIDGMKDLRGYKDFFIYCIFGAMATGVNMLGYHLLYDVAGIRNVPSTFLAWLFAVTFAFFTNKFFVFVSFDRSPGTVMKELAGFFSCRISTGVMDVVFMYVTVDLLDMPPVLFKFISNLMVGIINYLVGKLVIFKRK